MSATRPTTRGFVLETEHWIDQPIDTVFAFFSDAMNLQRLTPHWLNFRVLTPAPIAMRVGTLIDYKLRLRFIPLRWQSEITAWEPPRRFIDEQRRGPYRFWRHEHTFETRDGGTLVRDRVEYNVWGGALINRLFVRPDLDRIFAFRKRALEEHFARPAACHAESRSAPV